MTFSKERTFSKRFIYFRERQREGGEGDSFRLRVHHPTGSDCWGWAGLEPGTRSQEFPPALPQRWQGPQCFPGTLAGSGVGIRAAGTGAGSWIGDASVASGSPTHRATLPGPGESRFLSVGVAVFREGASESGLWPGLPLTQWPSAPFSHFLMVRTHSVNHCRFGSFPGWCCGL